jgi:hypothetical protein
VLAAGGGWPGLLPCLLVYGAGVGLATAQLTNVVLAGLPAELSGAGSGVTSTARQIGSALGIAVLGTVLFGVAQARLTDALDGLGVPAAAASGTVSAVVDSAGGAIAGLSGAPAQAAKDAFTTGTAWSAFVAAGFLALGLLASLSLRPAPAPEPARGGEAGVGETAAQAPAASGAAPRGAAAPSAPR